MEKTSTSNLRRKRAGLLKRIQSLDHTVLRGSLITRFKRCGKAGCKCARSRGHGPKYYLSTSMPGQHPAMIYVQQDVVDQVELYLDNHKRLRALIEELCNINRELLQRKEKL